MNEIINVSMSDIAFANSTSILKINGLGSCVALAVFDIKSHYSALAHIMLPRHNKAVPLLSPGKFADTAIHFIIGTCLSEGIDIRNLRAKISGGSSMFQKIQKAKLNIGKKNIIAIRNNLKALDIPLLAEDSGGTHGRTVEFHTDTKIFLIKSHKFGIITL